MAVRSELGVGRAMVLCYEDVEKLCCRKATNEGNSRRTGDKLSMIRQEAMVSISRIQYGSKATTNFPISIRAQESA